MGVELRSFQRQFHTLMDTMKPQIRPRFVVWLDDRLAEFKVKGHMELDETLEDPQWIKSYMTSKRQAKELAIKKREAREAGSSGNGSEVHPKLEAKSESSNGVAHPADFQEESKEEKEDISAVDPSTEGKTQTPVVGQDFQLVEVKQEQVEEDDDDMIIVGETLAPQQSEDSETSYSQYNPNRQMYSGYRNYGPFQRKRQRFGALPQRTSFMSGNRFKARMKQNFRSPIPQVERSYQSHTITSETMYSSTPSSQYQTQSVFPGDTQQLYDTSLQTQPFESSESIQLPPHLQTESASAQMQLTEGIYGGEEGDMYAEYGDESYDSSYMAESAETSLQYDEEGNPVIQGEHPGGDSSLEPIPGTSDATSQGYEIQWKQNMNRTGDSKTFYLLSGMDRYECPQCARSFTQRSKVKRHIETVHMKIRKYSCFCGKTYKLKHHLDGHKITKNHLP